MRRIPFLSLAKWCQLYIRNTKTTPTEKNKVCYSDSKKVCFPSSSTFICLPFFLFLTHFLRPAILVRTLWIVNGFWFSWRRKKLNKKNNNHFLCFGKKKRNWTNKSIPASIRSIYVDPPTPNEEVYIKNAWKWTFERFCISIFIFWKAERIEWNIWLVFYYFMSLASTGNKVCPSESRQIESAFQTLSGEMFSTL